MNWSSYKVVRTGRVIDKRSILVKHTEKTNLHYFNRVTSPTIWNYYTFLNK